YTPSNRLIQRPWDGSFDEYLTYTLKDQNPNRQHPASDLRYTDAGRKVYSGGGIEPDRRVDGPVEGFSPTRFGRLLYARQVFAAYAQLFAVEGDTRVASRAGHAKSVGRNFVVDDAMIADFRQFLRSDRIRVQIEEDAFSRDIEFIRAMMHYDIDLALFGVSEARRNLVGRDPQAQTALESFPDAVKLAELRRAKTAAGPGR
ncbi:MAG: hypothetical protein IMZ44_17805, partial [Planctomycetes bacterium]|nr:hypothetical protein [Planctomycetota bacterium]